MVCMCAKKLKIETKGKRRGKKYNLKKQATKNSLCGFLGLGKVEEGPGVGGKGGEGGGYRPTAIPSKKRNQ